MNRIGLNQSHRLVLSVLCKIKERKKNGSFPINDALILDERTVNMRQKNTASDTKLILMSFMIYILISLRWSTVKVGLHMRVCIDYVHVGLRVLKKKKKIVDKN